MYKRFFTDAIILSRRDLSNFDIEFSCYSEDYGIIFMWQKFHSSKNFRTMDFFCYSSINFSIYTLDDKEFYNILDFDVIDSNYNIRLDIKKFNIASYFVKILSKKIFRDSKEIFYFLKDFLYIVNYNQLTCWDLEILKFIFFMKILQLDGYEFQIKECVCCHDFIPNNVKNVYFSVDSGGIICNRCITKLNFYERHNLVLINNKMIILLRICYNIDSLDFCVLKDKIFFNKSNFLGFDLFLKRVSNYYIHN